MSELREQEEREAYVILFHPGDCSRFGLIMLQLQLAELLLLWNLREILNLGRKCISKNLAQRIRKRPSG